MTNLGERLPDETWMGLALSLAESAASLGEVPVGALVVRGETLVATGRNERERRSDPTAHAEVLAMRRAGEILGNWRLMGCTLFVTLEPCVMCAAAASHARVDRVVFGACDAKFGGVESLYRIGEDPRLNHRFAHHGRVLEDRVQAQLRDFFRSRRSGLGENAKVPNEI